MANNIVQLTDYNDNNIYPIAGAAAQGSITKSMLEEGVFEGPELSEPSSVAYVATDNIQDGAVTSDKIANNAVTNAKIDWSTTNGTTNALWSTENVSTGALDRVLNSRLVMLPGNLKTWNSVSFYIRPGLSSGFLHMVAIFYHNGLATVSFNKDSAGQTLVKNTQFIQNYGSSTGITLDSVVVPNFSTSDDHVDGFTLTFSGTIYGGLRIVALG